MNRRRWKFWKRKLWNQDLFPEEGAMFCESQRLRETDVEITTSWCRHQAFLPPDNVDRAMTVQTICTDCGVLHFPEHFGKVLDAIEKENS